MWVRHKQNIDLVDSKIVKNDFIIAQGSTLKYTFLSEGNKQNPFNRGLWAPVFYIFKVHRNHPLNIRSAEINHLRIYPANELKKKHPRMPTQVYADKMDYDISTFLMVPYSEGDFGTAWKKYEIPGGFVPVSGEKRNSLLLYVHGQDDLHSQDSLIVSDVMPSQVLAHLNDWMYEASKIISHDKTFDQKLEGMVSVPDRIRWKILPEITKDLEEAYKTRLSFEK